MGHTRHNHPGAEEIINVLEGTGEQMVEDDTGNPHTEQVHPDTCIFIPESRFHSTLNTGAVEMRIFVVYSPAGPASGSSRLSCLTTAPRCWRRPIPMPRWSMPPA